MRPPSLPFSPAVRVLVTVAALAILIMILRSFDATFSATQSFSTQTATHGHPAPVVHLPSCEMKPVERSEEAKPKPRKPFTPKTTQSYSYHHTLLQTHGWNIRQMKFGNVCTYKGQLWYFMDPSRNRQQPLTNNQEFKARLPADGESPWLSLDSRGIGWAPSTVSKSIQEFAAEQGAQIQWRIEPLYFLIKHSCANAGHCVLEAMFPVVNSMVTWGVGRCQTRDCSVYDNQILFMETVNNNDCGCGSYGLACGMAASQTPALCNQFVNNTVQLLSNNPIKYLNELPSIHGKEMECWLEAYSGHGAKSPYLESSTMYPHSSGYLRAMRDVAYERTHIQPKPLHERLQRFEGGHIHILAAKKVGRRMIKNFDEVITWIQGMTVSVDGYTVKPVITPVSWEEHTIVEPQLRLLANADILFTSAGSASVQSLFLPENTAMVTQTFCDPRNGEIRVEWCDAFEWRLTYQYTGTFQCFYYPIDNLQELVPSAAQSSYDTVFRKERFLPVMEAAITSVIREVINSNAIFGVQTD